MILQKSSLLLATFIFAGMISCNSEKDTETTAIENSASVEVPVAAPASDLENALSAPAMAPAPAATQNLALNPPHGQPGHDCAVEVGAPLTGSAPAPAIAAPNATPTMMATPPGGSPIGGTTPRFNANAKLNPAHGQPGHDCAVAVGAPLPSR